MANSLDSSDQPKSSKKTPSRHPDQDLIDRGRTSFAAALAALRAIVKPVHTKGKNKNPSPPDDWQASAIDILDYLSQFENIPDLKYSPTTTSDTHNTVSCI